MDRVTIGVPTRNRPNYLSGLLSSLLSQTFSGWDLLIVNDGDSDLMENEQLRAIFDVIKRKGHAIKIVPGPRKGPGHAHNLIVANSKTPLILRVDDDVYLEPRYIEILYNLINREDGIGGVGGRVLNPKYLNSSPQFPKEWRGKIIYKDGHFIPYQYHPFPPKEDDEPYEVDHLLSTFLYWRRIVEEVGGFPEVYSQMGRREETDTTIRMRMAGYRLYVVPDAIAWHLHSLFGGTRDGIGPQNYRRYLLMEDEDVILFENRMWGWIRDGLRDKIRIIIPDEVKKLRRLRYLLRKPKDFSGILEGIRLKCELMMRLTEEEFLLLLLSKLLTTYERDELEG